MVEGKYKIFSHLLQLGFSFAVAATLLWYSIDVSTKLQINQQQINATLNLVRETITRMELQLNVCNYGGGKND